MTFLVNDIVHDLESVADWTTEEVTAAEKWTTSEVGKLAGWTVSTAEGVGQKVFDFVVSGIRGVEHVFWDALGDVHHVLNRLNHDVGDIGGWAASAVKWIDAAPGWLGSHVEGYLHDFYESEVVPIEHDVTQLAARTESDIASATLGAVQDAEHYVSVVARPALSFVEHAETWFASSFHAAWNAAYHDVLAPELAPLLAVGGDLVGAVEWVVKYGPQIVKLVVGAGDWLGWMAAHSFADIEELANLVVSGDNVPTLLDKLSGAPSQVPGVEDLLGPIFGVP